MFISMILQQNARVSAASLLPKLSHLPPSMILPGQETVRKIANGDEKGDMVQSQKSGEE